MKNKTKVVLVSFLLCMISCKKETKKLNKSIQTIESNKFKINIDFPDTVYVGEFYNGKINYKNQLDTVTTELLNKRKFRFIEFGFSVNKDLKHNLANLKASLTDTFVAETNRMIPLYNMKFNKEGIRYIDGIITDHAEVDGVMLRDGKMQNSTRIITNEFRVTHKVVIIEKPR